MKNSITALLFLFNVFFLLADPPNPPIGKRWILNETFSDEFNGTALDSNKWYDYHPKWIGREPGIFLPSQVSVGGGYMKITGKKLKKDTIVKAYGRELTFNIAGGAVISKSNDAFYGYYECKFKAAKTTMSTTFWLSTNQRAEGPNGCDNYGLELDIQECIGRTGDFNGSYFAQGMNSNSHFWYTDCEKKKHDLRAPQSKIKTKTLPSDDFYTYGGWWHDASKVSYYVDDRKVKSVQFYSDIKEKPFDQPMHVNLVSETYPFPWIELPNEKELADPSKNTCLYDWVRAYTLVDIDEKVKKVSYPNKNLFNANIYFNVKPEIIHAKNGIETSYIYKANSNCELFIKIIDSNKKVVFQSKEKLLAGHGHKALSISKIDKLKNNQRYTIKLIVKEQHQKKALTQDEFNFTFKK